MSNFRVGQKVVCVDDSLPANPWHCAYPLKKNQIYIISSLEGPDHIAIDGSRRAWQNWRFRPLVDRKTDTGMAILTKILDGSRVLETTVTKG